MIDSDYNHLVALITAYAEDNEVATQSLERLGRLYQTAKAGKALAEEIEDLSKEVAAVLNIVE